MTTTATASETTRLTDRAPVRRPLLPAIVAALTLLFVGIVVGSREFSVGTDTANYVYAFQKVQLCNCMLLNFEPAFEVLSWLIVMVGGGPRSYLLVLAIGQLALLWAATGRVGGSDVNERERFKVQATILAFFFASPFFLSAQINAIRQGTAAVMLLFAIASLYERRYRSFAFWGALSTLIHYSSVLYLAAMALVFAGAGIPYVVAAVSLVLYVTGITELVVQAVSAAFGLGLYELIKLYGLTVEYQSGVRIDFAAASVAFLFIGTALRAIANPVLRPRIDFYLRAYACLMLPFLWFGWAAFSNRFAYTPWLLVSSVMGLAIFPRLHRLAPSVFAAVVVACGFLYAFQVWSMGR